METKLSKMILLLLLMFSDIKAQDINLPDITINNQYLKRLNCDFKNWGRGKVIKSWNGENDEYSLEYNITDYDSVQVLTANYKETKNSYLEMVTLNSPKSTLGIHDDIIKVGISIERLGTYLPLVEKEYSELINKNNKYLSKEVTVSTPLKIKTPSSNEEYFGKISFDIFDHKIMRIKVDLRGDGDY